jgi:hypothetical protein
MLQIISTTMSYIHTLSIQGVQATLQMNVEHSVVSYTLTMRSDSGEEVVANGRLPNDAMDNFIVINQYVKNPAVTEVKHTSEQGVQAFSQQSVKDHIITDLFDFINKGKQQCALIQENQLHHSQTSIAAPHPSLETEGLSESMSLIVPSSPTHVDDSCFAQDCLGQELRELYGLPAGSSEKLGKPLDLVTLVEEKPTSHAPCSELAIMEQLQHLREYTHPDIKNGIIQAMQQYLSENNINLLDYCTLCEYMKELFYELIVLHINDNVLVDKFIEMLYLTGEQSHVVVQYRDTMYRQYALLCRVATYYKLTMDYTSFTAYKKWKKTYHGPSLDRWCLMKTFLESNQ